jgi:hypothetical protein
MAEFFSKIKKSFIADTLHLPLLILQQLIFIAVIFIHDIIPHIGCGNPGTFLKDKISGLTTGQAGILAQRSKPAEATFKNISIQVMITCIG